MSGGVITEKLRTRAASIAAAAVVCLVFCALLIVASRTDRMSSEDARGVEVFIARREVPPPRPRTPSQPRAVAPADARAPSTAPSVETQMLRRLLTCVTRAGERPRPNCPREPAPEDWATPQLQVGGDFAQPEQPDMDAIYTPAEQRTLVMPSCVRDGPPATGGAGVSVCAPFGTTPPPPSRSAEQICRDANMGGPCETPPFREEDVVRRRHSQ